MVVLTTHVIASINMAIRYIAARYQLTLFMCKNLIKRMPMVNVIVSGAELN